MLLAENHSLFRYDIIRKAKSMPTDTRFCLWPERNDGTIEHPDTEQTVPISGTVERREYNPAGAATARASNDLFSPPRRFA